jgi:ribosome-binding factor A
MPYRAQKITEAIKHAVAEIILEDLADPKLGFVSVNGVRISNDYKKATVYFTAFGDNIKQEEVLRHLNHAANFIRSHLKEKVVLRYIPELTFEIDRLLEEEQKIGKVLDELKKSENSNQ